LFLFHSLSFLLILAFFLLSLFKWRRECKSMEKKSLSFHQRKTFFFLLFSEWKRMGERKKIKLLLKRFLCSSYICPLTRHKNGIDVELETRSNFRIAWYLNEWERKLNEQDLWEEKKVSFFSLNMKKEVVNNALHSPHEKLQLPFDSFLFFLKCSSNHKAYRVNFSQH
jgi:hypothetical protein